MVVLPFLDMTIPAPIINDRHLLAGPVIPLSRALDRAAGIGEVVLTGLPSEHSVRDQKWSRALTQRSGGQGESGIVRGVF
ncbi:hypothetical protein [Pseudomonas huanghezhanensis]|uniref:hypothetical protein n=1 Tax=Pseudomonas huanghezhanensis TaxID=3002903 RepID=UPI00228673C5|nr:hypothetical protein [Pseudomonas sp. BSw22131]